MPKAVRRLATASCLGAAAALILACGGGNAAGPEAASPPPADPSQTTASAPVDPSKGSGPATTTTPATGSSLPDGGELQGAKLSSSSTTEIENKTAGTPRPKAGSDEPGRRREDIQTLVMARRDEARRCYDDGVKSHPGVEGDLVVKWTIDPKGAPTDVMVDDAKSQIHEPGIGTCVVNVIKAIKFNESAKGFETRTSYPFNFKPKGPQPAGKK